MENIAEIIVSLISGGTGGAGLSYLYLQRQQAKIRERLAVLEFRAEKAEETRDKVTLVDSKAKAAFKHIDKLNGKTADR